MPLSYEKVPPTADDVKLDSTFATKVYDTEDDMVLFVIAQQDALQFAQDIERNPNGNINLNEVRRGLTQAAEVLTNIYSRTGYVRGVESFIEHQLRPRV